tara:strand:- start:55 stop:600 length:546 start_codon:yes stop_codon:yes gene_type:complete
MVKVVMIDKNSNIKTVQINKFSVDILYKRCKFNTDKHFDKRTVWHYDNKKVSLYSKNAGRANSENKYEFPPPIDSELYFGTVVLVAHNTDEVNLDTVVDFTKDEWTVLYDKLMGGVEILGSEDSYSTDDEDNDLITTKQGYAKDGFVVSDNESDNNIESETDSDGDYQPSSSELSEEEYDY